MPNENQHTRAVLYLSYDGLADPLGQSQIMPYLMGLSRMGYRLTLISFEKGNQNGQQFENLKKTCTENQIIWLPLTYHKFPPIISTIYDLFILNLTVKNLLKKQNYWFVHCRSYITSLIGLRLKEKYELDFIFDMRGFWADERVDGGIWNLQNPVYRIIYNYFKKKEIRFILKSKHIITLTINAKNEIKYWFKDKIYLNEILNKITVIPTCVDTELFDPARINPADQNAIHERLNLNKDSMILIYVGSLGTWYMLNEMLDFFDVTTEHFQDPVFIFLTREVNLLTHKLVERKWNRCIGEINQDRTYSSLNFSRDYCFSRDGNNSGPRIIITTVERKHVPVYISISVASICFILPAYSKKASSATKIAEVMAMGKPVITNSGWGDVSQIVLNNETGIILNQLTKENYRAAISNFKFDLPTNSGSTFRENLYSLSLKSGILKYNEIYKSLSKGKND